MNIIVEEISKSYFKELDIPILFDDILTDRVFGIIIIEKKQFKFGWQSTIIKPKLTIINNSFFTLGIDLNFVIFDIDKNQAILKLTLNYFFYDTEIHKKFLYIFTELEIIKINILNFEIIEKYDLPDYFESIEFKNEFTSVKCIGGEIINL